MPVYEYDDTVTGRVILLSRPVAERDAVAAGLKRRQVPSAVHFITGAPDPTGPDCAIPKALKELEQTQDHRKIAKGTGFSTQAMKEIWKI